MSKVELELHEYENLKSALSRKRKLISSLENKISELESKHESEIEQLVKEGKVLYVGLKRHAFLPFILGVEREVKNLDSIKNEVEEHFKQGLFNDELEKHKKEHLDYLIKQVSEKDAEIDKLIAEVERLKSRNLWDRIVNK